MKSTVIVLICLIPFVLVMAYRFYEKNNCMSESEAEIVYNSALDKEIGGKLKEAYFLFKQVDVYACENYQLRGKAFNKAVSLKKKVGL
jgi:predicted negative regulator of RcsB-dependent stress response